MIEQSRRLMMQIDEQINRIERELGWLGGDQSARFLDRVLRLATIGKLRRSVFTIFKAVSVASPWAACEGGHRPLVLATAS
jgi:hypothetical protein